MKTNPKNGTFSSEISDNRLITNQPSSAKKNKIVLVILFLCLASSAPGGNSPTVRWGRQLVTPTKDSIFRNMVTDSNNDIYMAIPRRPKDAPDKAGKDFYLLKFNQDGEQTWSRQFAENVGKVSHGTVIEGLAADGQDNIYVFGFTDSKLGPEKKGGYDAFVAKYNQAGIQQWVWQLGTGEHDVCTGMDIDSAGNIYIAGYTYGAFAGSNKGLADIFIAAYDKTGKLLWQDQAGTDTDDKAMELKLADNNDLYLCGTTNGKLAEQSNGLSDFVVARYERTGKLLWLNQYGTQAAEAAACMEISEHGHVYVGGITYGNFASKRAQRGQGDAFVARIAKTGELLWRRQFGSNRWDQTWDMAAFQDGSGDILAGGCQIPSQICQGFCRRYTPDGKLVWIKEFRERSPQGGTCGRAVAIDSDNNCYHAGVTHADQFGVNNGTGNVYIVRFDGMPEKP